jgi:hypothetical protein
MDELADFLRARYEVRRADGTTFGPVSAYTLAEWREAHRVADADEIRRVTPGPDQDWVALRDSEFLRSLPDEPLSWTDDA